MGSTITLEGVTFAIAGTFDAIDVDDAKWGLISRGARASASVGKRTQVLIAGNAAKAAVLQKAADLGVPVVGEVELHRLLGGEGLRAVLDGPPPTGDVPAKRSDLRGLRVAISGSLAGFTHAQVKIALEGVGARVTGSVPTVKTQLLIVGQTPGFEALEQMDAGLPRITQPAVEAILRGAPLSDFVRFVDATPSAGPPEARIDQLVRRHLDEILALSGFDALYPDVLIVTARPTGRVSFCLTDLSGTPTEDHVRDVLQRETWPSVTTTVEVSFPVTFGDRSH